jgi:hypothetical protein
MTFTPGRFSQTATAAPYASVTVPRSGLLLKALGGPTQVGVRRFGDAFQPLGTLAPGGPARLVIAPDRSLQRWNVQIRPAVRALACGL